MHVKYAEISYEDARRILHYCQCNSVKDGGLFEPYSTPGQDLHLVIVNSCAESDPDATLKLRPLGGFYLNYMGPGIISIEEDDPHFDGAESRKRHVRAVKQVIDILIREGYPGVKIKFNDLPALQNLADG